MPTSSVKPIEGKAYGSIPHLSGSKQGLDKGIDETQSRRLLEERYAQAHDRVIVQEKLDGSNVVITKIQGKILSLSRRGYLATSSPFEMHHIFAQWVEDNLKKFEFLEEGQRLCGEWLAQAHGTRYQLGGRSPFVAFDLILGRGKKNHPLRTNHDTLEKICRENNLPTPYIVHDGVPLSIKDAIEKLGSGGHGAVEKPEGAIWRLENKSQHILIAKYLRPDSTPGRFLPEISGGQAIWNWRRT